MKVSILLLLWFNFVVDTAWTTPIMPQYAITNDSGFMRLGDQLIGYGKAKWLAQKYNIPFYLSKFEYSDQLALSNIEKKLSEKIKWQNVHIRDEDTLISYLQHTKSHRKKPILFLAGIVTRISKITNFMDELYLMACQNEQFKIDLKQAFQPLVPVEKIKLPNNMITVAVHVRKGSGGEPAIGAEQYFDDNNLPTKYDIVDTQNIKACSMLTNVPLNSIIFCSKNEKNIDKLHPNKFPPEQYYVNQIKKLSELLHDAPLFVYIFTDDPMPQELIKRFEKAVNKKNIVFATRETENNYLNHIFDDLCQMAQFDCLIRAFSGFSFLSQFLGSHKIIFSPWHSTWITEKRFFIDKISIFVNKPTEDDPNKELFDLLRTTSKQ